MQVLSAPGKRARAARRPAPLKADRVYRPANLGYLKVKSTDELEPIAGVIEQKRPREALELGLRVHSRNFHVFVTGPPGTGKMTTTMRLLNRDAPKRPVPKDMVFVHNFDRPEEPLALALPPARGVAFRRDMARLIEDLRREIPDAYHSKEHQEQIQAILNRGIEKENESFAELKKHAAKLEFVVRTSKQGLTVLPVVDGAPLAHKEYTDQPKSTRDAIEKRRKKLDPVVSAFFELSREIEKESQLEISELQRGMGDLVVRRRIEALAEGYGEDEGVSSYLVSVFEHILDNLDRFLPDDTDHEGCQEGGLHGMPEYRVNVVVDHRRTRGAPVVVEDRPTYYNLFGRIEKRVEYGIYSTDHTMIKAGSILKANGGYLVLNAADLFAQPGVWDTLKATMRSGQLRIEDLGEAHGFLPTSGIRPEAIPIDVKLVLIGGHQVYDLLYRHDSDFPKLFRVKAEFDDVIERRRSTERAYARFITGVCKKDRLLPVEREGLEALVETGSYWAESQQRLSLAFNEIAGLLIEADDNARRAGREVIGRAEVEGALRSRDFQVSYLRDQLFEDLEHSRVLVATDGEAVGTINALSVFQDGPHVFAKPTRVTARAFAGAGGVLNVEREARLSGRIYDKAVAILSGYLGGQYGTLTPTSAFLSICFEQSYGYVDGDSASLAEALAVLSELSGLPARQDIGVTGSINQFGEVQAIGSVNAKIEGFHRLCRMRKANGCPGVVIPAGNVRDLMLPERVRADVDAGRFAVYPVRSVDQAAALLLDRNPGAPSDDGFRPYSSVHAMVLERLGELHRLSDHRGDDQGGGPPPEDGQQGGAPSGA